MNKAKLTEAVFRALKPVKEEEEEIEDVEVDVEDEVEIEEPTGAVVQSGAVQKVQTALVAAIDAAQELEDKKLITQLGNTYIYLSRSQVKGAQASVDENKSSRYSRLAEKVVSRIRESIKKASLKEFMNSLPVPFDKTDGEPFDGVFLSNDSGKTGIFITNDPEFDHGQYQSVGDYYEISGFKVLEVF